MKTTVVAPLAVLTLMTVAGCTSPEHGTESDWDGGEQPETRDDSSTSPPQLEPVWRESSQRIELSSFGFFEGSQGYDITRDQLSDEQLDMLAGLREINTPEGPLGADYVSYVVRITDRSGDVVEYRSAQENVRDSDEGPVAGKRTLDYETLAPFLTTFNCMSAKEYRDPGDASMSDRWAGAATFSSDPNCTHGVFVSSETSHSYRKWQVDEPGTYSLSVVRCFQQMQLHLYDEKDQKELSSSETTIAPDCPTLVHHFDAPGVYLIDLEKNRAHDSPHDTAGDTSIRVTRQ